MKAAHQPWRHPLEWWLFGLATLVSLAGFVITLGVSFFKTETLQALRHYQVSEFKAEHPGEAHLDEAQILTRLP